MAGLSEKDVESIVETYFPYFMPLSMDGALDKLVSDFQHRAGVSITAQEFKKLLEKTDSAFSKDIFSMIATLYLAQEVQKYQNIERDFLADRERFADQVKTEGSSKESVPAEEEVKKLDDSSGKHKQMLDQFKVRLELYKLCFQEMAQWSEKKRLLQMQLTTQSQRHRDNFNAILEKKGLSPKYHLTQARHDKIYEECEKYVYEQLKKKENQKRQEAQVIHEIQTSKEFQEHVALKIADHFVSIPATPDERKVVMNQRMSIAKATLSDFNERFTFSSQMKACDLQIQTIQQKAAEYQKEMIAIGPLLGLNSAQLTLEYQNVSESIRELTAHLKHGMRKH